MDSIFKSMLGFFFLALLTVTSVCVIAASIDNTNARSYHTAIMGEMENSNYSDTVINSLGTTALSHGYELEVVLHHDNGSTETLEYKKTGNTLASGIKNVAFAEVNLKFDFSFKLMNTVVPHVIKGIAR